MGATLKWLITFAFGVREELVERCPEWAEHDFFDIDAKAGRDANKDETRAMLRSLLVQRFALKYHLERKSVPGYDIAVADRSRLPKSSEPGSEIDGDGSIALTPTAIIGRGATISSLSEFLWSGILQTAVQNTTALDGPYDFKIPFDRKDPDSILSGIKAIGLELKKAKLELKFLYVDSAHQPSPN